MQFCSHCGSDQLQFRIPADDNRERYVCGHCDTIHYQNPKLVVGCLPFWEDQVLLCRRAIAPAYGLWNIASGYMENQETLAEGAQRELWEEAKAKIDIHYLATVYDIPRISQVYVQFVGELVEGKFGVGEESLECQLFKEEDIPWEEIAFTSSVFTLRHFFAARKAGRAHLHQGCYPDQGNDLG